MKKQKQLTKKRFTLESLAVLLILITPFLFKIHEYFPEDPEAKVSILGFEITRNGFQDISVYVWFLLGKFIPLYLLTLWFLTCKHWWYHAILIPITMYAFQIFEVIFSDDKYVDTDNIMWLLPVCMAVIPLVYLVRIKLYDRYVHGIDLEAMETELQTLKAKQQEEKRIEANRAELPEVEYRSLSQWLNEELSTARLQEHFTRLKLNLKHWLF